MGTGEFLGRISLRTRDFGARFLFEQLSSTFLDLGFRGVIKAYRLQDLQCCCKYLKLQQGCSQNMLVNVSARNLCYIYLQVVPEYHRDETPKAKG